MSASGARRVLSTPDAVTRLQEASLWLERQGRATEVVVIGATADAVAELTRTVGRSLEATFGWHRFTLPQLAWTLGAAALADRGLTPVSHLALEALSARVVHAARGRGALGRFSPIGDRPGLPGALARTFSELRLAGIASDALDDADLGSLYRAYVHELGVAKLADRAEVLAAATATARAGHALLGVPLLLLDVAVGTTLEHELVCALVDRSLDLLATVPLGDDRTLAYLRRVDGLVFDERLPDTSDPLTRLQSRLFGSSATPSEPGAGVEVFSSPGESRECVEIARRLQQAAAAGTAFDAMAVVLRAPLQYRAPLAEALHRAGIPATFARGTARPDPSGRAFLALLACAAEGLSASRFSEYLSIGEVPEATPAGAPPPAAAQPWALADDELVVRLESEEAPAMESAPAPDESPVVDGTLRTPWLWERLLVDAAVIGGLDRWQRRLDGLARELRLASLEQDDPEDPRTLGLLHNRRTLEGLRAYALPLLSDLVALPGAASWGDWLKELGALATRSLRNPERVLAVLAELAPMHDVGPVGLAEVRAVLGPRLTEVVKRPPVRRYGAVFVGSPADVRGLTFDVVFVPGLAEKVFPQRIAEDPILPDHRRGPMLPTNVDRRSLERLALRLAVGAASHRVVVSYPRLDQAQSRPRTPSFYGLEVLRAAEGTLPGFDELVGRANVGGAAHIGWPAPDDPSTAIDDAEHDLALLRRVLARPESETVGMARYLLSSNPHLGRALRVRASRWLRKWTPADGLVQPADEARVALRAHDLAARSYSPTGLQHYAACPYRFFLQAVHRLAPRLVPTQIETLDPLQRGRLIHEAQFELLGTLRDERLLPVTEANLKVAQAHLEVVLDRLIARYEDELYPAIPRVWEDAVAGVRADVREWLRQASPDRGWNPKYFELAFGLDVGEGRDARSQAAPATLECGIQLRGSIDLVERRRAEDGGGLRATDHKTGKARAKDGVVIAGGTTLQPVLYALALEQVLPGERTEAGRLYYCTSVGEFTEVVVPLDPRAREAAQLLATTIRGALETAFLPAAPAKGECDYCDYLTVCGPHEPERTRRKSRDLLVPLEALRRMP